MKLLTTLIGVTLLIAYCCLLSVGSFAQDIHFSQFSQTPLSLNPALTGIFNGDQRVILNYKNQWQTVAPYRTYLFAFDAGLLKKKWDNNYLGTGITAFSDKAGDAQLGMTQFNLSVADILSIGENQQASVGLQGGYVQQSMDNANLKWGNQFNGQTFDPTLDSREKINTTSSYWDIAAGGTWNYSIGTATMSSNDAMKMSAGIAIFHLNKPQYGFSTQEELHIKYVVHGGVFFGLKNTNGALLPSFLYLKQGSNEEINAGLMYRYILKEESRYTQFVKGAAISFGGYYRMKDAFIPAVLLEMGSFSIGMSYDVNVSKLKIASNARGGIEVSLRYINPNPFHYGKGKEGRNGNVRFL